MARFFATSILVLLLTGLPLVGCGNDPDRPAAVEENGQRFLLCGRLADDRQEEEIDAGTVRFKRRGFVVERVGENDGKARFGVISGIEEWNEPNRANVDSMVEWFKTQQVEAIIAAGGIGSDRESCLNVFKRLAASKLPVLPLIGAAADFSGYRRAVAQAQREHKNVVDLTTVRLLHWDGVDLVSLPGYYNPFYLSHRRGGCAYQNADVEALGELIGSARQPVLLVAAGPPRGRAPHAVDRARGGVNIGDPQLTRLIEARSVPFGIFGHVYEAGGHATSDVAGRRAAPPERWSKTLFLNPGAVEAVPYDLMGGGRSRGMGAVLDIGPEGARYRLHRLERLPPAPAKSPAPSAGEPDGGRQGDAG